MLKKVLFVEQTVDGTIGGSHYCLLYLLQYLDRSLYKPLVIFYEKNALIENFQRQCPVIIFKLFKFTTYRIKTVRKGINLFINLINIFRCYSFLKKNKIDIVHLNNSASGGYHTWLVACISTGIPCITHERNFTRYPKTALFSYLKNKYKGVLAVSNVIRDHMIAQGIHPHVAITVHDGIDADTFYKKVKKTRQEMIQEFGIQSDAVAIGLIGNIREWKGQELLIDALNIVQKTHPDFFCLLVGDTSKHTNADREFAKRLIEKINKYGIAERVILTGYRNDIPDIINLLDLQINASIRPDPFPHVILEGMSLGKAVIATNLGGAVESIDDGQTGFLVPPDCHLLAEKIIVLMSDTQLRQSMSANAKKRVQLFSMTQTIQKIEEIYEKFT